MPPRLLLLALLSAAALVVAGCGEDAGTTPTGPDVTVPATDAGGVAATTGAETSPEDDPGEREASRGEARRDRDGSRPSDARRRAAGLDAEDAYRVYIDAINARDGAALCALLSPAAVRVLRPPVHRSSCAATLTASIGYRDPRGYPVWRRTHLNAIDRTQVSADLRSARITAAIVTEFADRDEPSVESDIAYLERAGGGWRLAKPSSALYRALGNAEPPPSVIAPPQG